MKNTRVLAIIVFVMAVANFATADTIRGINIDFVNIGHAGNAADTGGTPGCGAVGYNYRIGKYDITNAQWNTFTITAGAPAGSDFGYSDDGWVVGYNWDAYYTGAQQPVNRVSWYEAAQFCNYLTSGDKSKGAYQFNGNNMNPGAFQGINRAAAISAYGTAYVIPTEDEWYKAAYYKPDGSGYSLYANGTSTPPIAGVQSNYNWAIGSPWNIGSGTMEQNSTYDMMGNIWQWNESYNRGICGGAYSSVYSLLSSSFQTYIEPYNEVGDVGFRVAEVPEPATLLLLGLGAAVIRKSRN